MTAPLRVGRYEIVRRLSKSMTDVYLAIDTVENRQAALKLIKTGGDTVSQLVLESERRGAAIQKELQALDPRIVEIYDYGDADGYFFVAMQYVEGHNLAEILEQERIIDPARAATIALEICEQLAKFHAWQSAVVHGDIKPSNIHLGRNGTVRLLDFGIAKTLRENGDATDHNFGSPSYCSPERLTHSQVDQQSDLWAMGATLYEMLAGVPPYQADSTRKLEGLIRSKRPPRALPPGCPRALRGIVMKALAPDAARRYRTAREFQEDLQAYLERRPTLAEMERRPWGVNASATFEAARAYLRKATRTLGQAPYRWPVLRQLGAVLWFAAGMVLWIGGTFAWQWAQAGERVTAAEIRPASIASMPKDNLPALYTAAGERILAAYRNSTDPVLQDFDWHKAEVCLERAVELGSGDNRTVGMLALARGYATLERLSGGEYSEAAARPLRLMAFQQFTLAAQKLPHDPDPHLALARIYVYSLPNLEKALAEFGAAEQVGAAMGRREIEQQADAYRIRAQQEADTAPKQALLDAAKARRLYERIPGFDKVGKHLKELARIEAPPRRPIVRQANTRRPRRWL